MKTWPRVEAPCPLFLLLCDQPGVHWPGYWHQAANWNTIGQWSKLPPPVTIFSIHTSHHSGLWAGIQANQCTEPKMYPVSTSSIAMAGVWKSSNRRLFVFCFITIIPPTLLYVGKQNWLYLNSKIYSEYLFPFHLENFAHVGSVMS